MLNRPFDVVHPRVRVMAKVRLKPTVLDPQSTMLSAVVQDMGYTDVISVMQGKFFQITLVNQTLRKAQADGIRMCRKLLANKVIEIFSEVTAEPI